VDVGYRPNHLNLCVSYLSFISLYFINHLWIFSGGSCYSSVVPFLFHKDQDQINVHSLSVEGRSISSLSRNNDQVRQKFFILDLFDKKEKRKKESGIPDYSKLISPINLLVLSNHRLSMEE
jgi:hypothetical protein